MAQPTSEQLHPAGSSTGFVILVSIVAALGGLLFGYDTAVISGATDFLQQRFQLSNFMLGWAVSCLTVGAAIGTAFAGKLSDTFGRKKALIFAGILFTIGSILSALPNSITFFVLARMVGGFGIGISSVQAPLYIAEISPARLRGRLVSLNQLAVVTGIFAVYFVDLAVSNRGDVAWNVSMGWRWMLGLGIVPGLLFIILLFTVPESPRWLEQRGRGDEALRILTKVDGEVRAKKELEQIRHSIQSERGNVSQLFRPGLRKALLIGVVLAVMQQWTGINAIMYYAPDIFRAAGAGQNSSLIQTVLVGTVNFLFTILSIWLIDKVGRKALLLVGSSVMAVCLFTVGIAFRHGTTGTWVLFFILLYVAAFAISLGPVVWLVIAEIFPNRARGVASSVASLALWAADYVVAQLFPVMLGSIGAMVTFSIFGVLSLFTFFFTLGLVPETKGKSLEEIEQMWR